MPHLISPHFSHFPNHLLLIDMLLSSEWDNEADASWIARLIL